MKIKVNRIDLLCDEEKCIDRYNQVIKIFPDITTSDFCKYDLNHRTNKYECCDYIKLYLDDCDLNWFKVGECYEYEITSDDEALWFYVSDKNYSDISITIYKGNYDYSKLKIGEYNVECVFDADRLSDFKKLSKLGFKKFPSFHETNITYIEQFDDYLRFTVEGGFSPLKTTFELSEITNISTISTDTDDLISYLQKEGKIGEIIINTLNDEFKIKIADNFICHNIENGSDIPVSHINELEITCKVLSFDIEQI